MNATYVGILFELQRKVAAAIENEITYGCIPGRSDPDRLFETIESHVEDAERYTKTRCGGAKK